MGTLPVLDLTESDDRVAASLSRAYREVGFATVVGHGISVELREQIFDASVRFHALPLAEKRRITLNDGHRGYIGFGTSTDSGSEYAEVTTPNQSESFMTMTVSGGFLAGADQWPDLDGFRPVVEAYRRAMTGLGRRIIDLFALALGDTDRILAPLFDQPTTWLRLLHYPPSPPETYGSAPHRDYGAITLLAQGGVPGLEVLTPTGQWLEVEPDRDAFVLNTGEIMHRWSNGHLLRTPHRVINRGRQERYSIPFFFDPDVRATIEPLGCCTGPDDPPRFAPVEFEDFLRAELTEGYEQHRPSN